MSSRPPIIGIAATTAPIRFQKYDVEAAFCPTSYIDALVAAGAVPVLLPPLPSGSAPSERTDDTSLTAVLDRLDALVVAGGDDVDPSLFGGSRKPTTTDHQLRRDLTERRAVQLALEKDLPLLGVCRGMQMLNVALGGTLVHDLVAGMPVVEHQSADAGFTRHVVAAAEGSLAAVAMGASPLLVPTLHHQAVDALGEGLTATAWAEDGVVEAIEAPANRFVLGVQWHPERDPDANVFRAFVGAVRT